MAHIFLSHSSKDKEFVRWLATSLEDLGHTVWFDEWDLKVGDCIVSGVQKGIDGADYVALVLSKNALASSWVENEWKAKYWVEIQERKVKILPIKLEDCEIPILLRTKKYADFSQNRTKGLIDLANALGPLLTRSSQGLTVPSNDEEVANLIQKIQSKKFPLSECIAEALTLSKKINARELELFCRGELSGWNENKASATDLSYRTVSAYVSLSEINLSYWGFGGDASNAISHMARDPENFKPMRVLFSYPISYFEDVKAPDKSIMSGKMPLKNFDPNTKHPDAQVNIYFRPSAYSDIVREVRAQLTKFLLELLPEVKLGQ